MKTYRLVSILVMLLRKRRMKAKELAEMFEVSTRTILRDVDALNMAGIPVITYQGANGGIGIADGFNLDKSVFTENEMANILTTLRGVGKALPSTGHEILLEKLKNVMSTTQLNLVNAKANQFILDPSPWGDDKISKKKAVDIHKAIENSKEIEFSYINIGGNKTTRIIEPYSLILKAQKWYLYGWCHLRNEYRLFKLTRMDNLVITDRVFDKKERLLEEYPWEEEWQKPDNLINLQLIFEKDMESVIVDFTEAKVEKLQDGKLLVTVDISENYWIYGFILSFGDKVEVISPTHIREGLKEVLKKVYKKYEGDDSCEI